MVIYIFRENEFSLNFAQNLLAKFEIKRSELLRRKQLVWSIGYDDPKGEAMISLRWLSVESTPRRRTKTQLYR